MKKALLMLAYGAPNSLDDVEPFYTDIRRGRKPPPELLEQLLNRYRMIGGKSPLLDITWKQARATARAMDETLDAYVGMRHWTPWIKDTVRQMADDGVEEVAALVMAPHYSTMSIAKYRGLVEEANALLASPMKIHFVESWHTEPAFIDALVSRIRDAQSKFSDAECQDMTVVFTAHSLPEKIREVNDPYPDQLLETSRLVAQQAGVSDWRFAFQSAGRTPEPWLGPDILEMLDTLAQEGKRSVLVCVVGFIADHLEVVYDIDIEAKPHARTLGIHLERIEMLNDDPGLIAGLARVAKRAFAS